MAQKRTKKETNPLATGYISEGKLHIVFSKCRFLDGFTTYHRLGKSLADFAWFEVDAIGAILDDLWAKYFVLKGHKDKYESVAMGLWITIEKYLGLNSYFTLYLFTYINFLMESIVDDGVLTYKKEIKDFAREMHFHIADNGDVTDLGKRFFISVFLKCIEERQQVVEKTLEKILVGASGDDERSAMARLYQMEHEDKFYQKHWHSRFETCIGKVSLDSDQLEYITMFETIDDMMRYELVQMILQEVKYKQCQCCGKLFISEGRSDSLYCDRIMPGQERPCNEIGANLVAVEKRRSNPALRIYRQAYERLYKRVEMSYMDRLSFAEWNKQALEKRAACLKGELPLDAFVRWIDETSRQRRGK